MVIMLQRLGDRCSRSGRVVVGAWLVALVVLGGAAAALAVSGGPGGAGAAAGSEGGASTARVVVELPEGRTVTDPADAQKLLALAQALGSVPQVVSVSNPLDQATPTVAPDMRAATLDVTFDTPAAEVAPASVQALRDAVTAATAHGWTAAVSGDVVAEPRDLPVGALAVGALAVVVVLLVATGSVLLGGAAAVSALVGAGTGTGLALLVVRGAGEEADATALAAAVGLAVGAVCSLVVGARLRGEPAAGRALGAAGTGVLATAGVCAASLGGLAAVGVPLLSQLGLAAAVAAVVAATACLTLLPALVGLLGDRVRASRASPSAAASWAAQVTRRPVLGVVAAVVVLAALAVPGASLRTALDDDGAAPQGSSQRLAHDLVVAHWGAGATGPLVVRVEGGSDPGVQATALAGLVQQLPGVPAGGVGAPVRSEDGTSAALVVVPASGPGNEESAELVAALRALPDSGDGTVSVTGAAADSAAAAARVAGAAPVLTAVLLILLFAVLLLVQRSAVLALVGALGGLLSVGAATGVLALAAGGQPVSPAAPLVVVGVLLGVTTASQVGVVAALRGSGREGRAAAREVTRGLRAVAPLVVALGLVVAGSFAGLAAQGGPVLGPAALAVAVGALLDAVLVRALLVPAAAVLLGARPRSAGRAAPAGPAGPVGAVEPEASQPARILVP